ncbi:restriction endonuclease [Pseudomonas syringae]|uniref:restriction endonuclease n=1 Tax=Pseudomonas syringae TaxID=317 RepID=UPI003F87D655
MPIIFKKTVHPINFQNLSGDEFERLVFASLLRMNAWHSLDWYGQTGGDEGRDIIGVRDDQYGHEETVVFACANWKAFTSTKGIADIDKIVGGVQLKPAQIVIIAGNSVSAATKIKCVDHAKTQGVKSAQVWSGSEFEELLRFHAASVLERFYDGEPLPDEPKLLRDFVAKLDPATEREAGELVSLLFVRPAFTTPISQESSLPDFRQAIGDTINALNTGIWRDREGAIISRVAPWHTFTMAIVKESLANASSGLNQLRIMFDEGLRKGLVRSLSGNSLDGPWFEIEQKLSLALSNKREEVLANVNTAFKALGVTAVGLESQEFVVDCNHSIC